MSSYAWRITTDHLDGEDVGVEGPRDMTPEQRAQLDAGEGLTFKLYDDDEELYYTGRIVGIADPNIVTGGLPEEAFAPLDDYGEPGAGCTMIKYRIGGKWEVL